MKPQEPIKVKISDIKKINGFGYWNKHPERGFLTNADIEGRERSQWYLIPYIANLAQHNANARGIGLGDVADNWNEQLRQAALLTEPKPMFSATWEISTVDAEQYEALKKVLGID